MRTGTCAGTQDAHQPLPTALQVSQLQGRCPGTKCFQSLLSRHAKDSRLLRLTHLMPSTSVLKPSRRGTAMTCASFTSASNTYMVNVGGQSTIESPGSKVQRMSRSINSSAPQPTCARKRGGQSQQQQERCKRGRGRSQVGLAAAVPGGDARRHVAAACTVQRLALTHPHTYLHPPPSPNTHTPYSASLAVTVPAAAAAAAGTRAPNSLTSRCSAGTSFHSASAARSRRVSGSG